jgi:hypothetical protein
VARAAREDRETAHERAADTEDVDVHKPVVPRGRFFWNDPLNLPLRARPPEGQENLGRAGVFLRGMGAQKSGRIDRLQRTLL